MPPSEATSQYAGTVLAAAAGCVLVAATVPIAAVMGSAKIMRAKTRRLINF